LKINKKVNIKHMATHKKINDPTNNRRKVIMYGCVTPNSNKARLLSTDRKTANEIVRRYKAITKSQCGICKVEMLVPSAKNQWTITMECCTTQSTVPVTTKKITLETVNRPTVWGTNRLTDEAVQAYIDAYIGDDPKEAENFRECNGTSTLFKNPRSPQIN